VQRKTTSSPRGPLASFERLFESPRGYVEQLQRAPLTAWLGALALACAGYAIFGLSVALSPHAGASLSAIWLTPGIFLIAQLISLPALYIFHAFLGSRLAPQQVAATGMIALLVPALLLAGMAPINWFMLASFKQPGQLIWMQQVTILGVAILGYIELSNTLPAIEAPAGGARSMATGARRGARKSATSQAATRRKQLLLVWVFLYIGVLYKVMKLLTQTHG